MLTTLTIVGTITALLVGLMEFHTHYPDISLFFPIMSLTIGGMFVYQVNLWWSHHKLTTNLDNLAVDIKSKFNNIERLLDKLENYIVILNNNLKSGNVTMSRSPLTLTPAGENLIRESEFDKFLNQNKADLIKRIEEKNPKTKYDVQSVAVVVLYDLSSGDYEPFKPLKKYCYDNGKDQGELLSAGSILLRDMYLSIHEEIKD